jgi:hypothetical protein
MPMNYSLVIEPFDCWGFDFTSPFPPKSWLCVSVDCLILALIPVPCYGIII